jgi:hypothetical protein
MKGSDTTMEKKALNANLTNLAEAVARCKKSYGIDSNMIFETVRMEMQKEPTIEQFQQLQQMQSILSASPTPVIKWTIYSKNRAITRKELLDDGFDLKDFIIVDGN